MRRYWNIVTPNDVFGLSPHANPLQYLRYVGAVRDWRASYLEQHVTRADARVVALAARRDVERKNFILAVGARPIHPGNSNIGKMIQALLAEIDDGAAHRRHCQHKQQRAGELSLKIPQAAVSAETPLRTVYPPLGTRHAVTLAHYVSTSFATKLE